MKQNYRDLCIDGRRVAADTSHVIPVVSPITEQQIASIPDCNANDVDRAVRSARTAFESESWSRTTAHDRAGYLHNLADVIEKNGEQLAELVTEQNGSTLKTSTWSNVKAPAEIYRYYAELAECYEQEEIRGWGDAHSIVRKEPLGVAALICAWNAPQAIIALKLAPLIAAGCTAVVKPAPETSLDSYFFAELVNEAGLPGGTVNFVTGSLEAGRALVAHPLIGKVSFTGSTAAGKAIARACGEQLKPVTLELGGKSAAVLLEDVNLDTFLPFISTLCIPNSGQICFSTTRVLAPRSRYSEIVDAIADTTGALTIGDPRAPETIVGPLVSDRQRDRVENFIQLGKDTGARIATGGGRPAGRDTGYFIEPTVFYDVDNSMPIAREEIFGPVIAVIPYENEDEAVAIANDSNFGLGGAIFTADENHGTNLARRIETGTIGVNFYNQNCNAPFGGYKDSGHGRELGPEALDSYLQKKSIYKSGRKK